MSTNKRYQATLTAVGHLVDSGILSAAMDQIVRGGGIFRVRDFVMGRTNNDPSRATLEVSARSRHTLDTLLVHLVQLGFATATVGQLIVRRAPKDGAAPDGFYSTTNHPTEIYSDNRWRRVKNQRMDSVVVLQGKSGRPECCMLRDLKRGARVVCGHDGIRIIPASKDRQRADFGFMTNDVSSEKKVEWVIGRLCEWIRNRKGKLIIVA